MCRTDTLRRTRETIDQRLVGWVAPDALDQLERREMRNEMIEEKIHFSWLESTCTRPCPATEREGARLRLHAKAADHVCHSPRSQRA